MQKKLTDQGLRYLEEGQFEKAGQVLSLLISRFPQNAEAHHMLGIIELEQGNFDAAYIMVNTAIDLMPNNSLFYNTMGNIELHRRNISNAEAAFTKAVKFDLDKIEYQYNLAQFYLSQNQYAKAIDYFYYILHTNPTHYLSIRGITVSYLYSGETEIALEHADEWVNEYPEYDEPYYYQGLCLFTLNDITGSLAAYDKGLNISPTNHEIISAIGACYRVMGNFSLAETYIHKALSLEARNPTAIYNLGCIHLDKGDMVTARNLFLNAINLDEIYAEPLCGLGCIELANNKDNLALEYFQQAQRVEPLNVMPRLLSATTLLRQQNFLLGWSAYQNIFVPSNALKKIPQWQGNKLTAKQTLLVWTPRENSDLSQQIMFASIIPDLQKIVENIIILCSPVLVSVLKNSFPTCSIIAKLDMNALAYDQGVNISQIALNCLGKFFRLNVHDFPDYDQGRYLQAHQERAEYFKLKYEQLFSGKKKIGIAWKSISSNKVTDHIKSSHLLTWEKLLNKGNCQFISLQEGEVAGEIRSINNNLRKGIYVDPEINFNTQTDLSELCAQISALDLIITMDNYVAHLAGAMGIKVFTLIPIQPEWYWFKDQTHSLWYPSMTIFRQNNAKLWTKQISNAMKII